VTTGGVCFVGREGGRGRGVGIAEEVGQRSTATRGSVELRSQSEQSSDVKTKTWDDWTLGVSRGLVPRAC
jgi:hypothetical protein